MNTPTQNTPVEIEIENLKDVPHDLGEQIRRKVHVKKGGMNSSGIEQLLSKTIKSSALSYIVASGVVGFFLVRLFSFPKSAQ